MKSFSPIAFGGSNLSPEEENFSVAARRLSGVAVLLLGWRLDEFWRATPDEMAAVFEALRGDFPAPVPMAALMERFPDG